jgi:outer membrane protein TolC
VAVKVRSQAREAYFNYRSAFDIAQHMQTEVLPTRKFINDELLLRYNGMLTSVFDVLADSQTQTQTMQAAVSAQRDFWLAHADLQAVLAGAPLDALGTNPGSADGNGTSGSSTAAH